MKNGSENNFENDFENTIMNIVTSANPAQDSAAPRQARWEILMQHALDLWFQTTCRQLARALHTTRRADALGSVSARQLRDLGMSQTDARGRDPHFVNAEAQLGMVR
jgi:uncharacterized protein YjiS (DUF1127 family)